MILPRPMLRYQFQYLKSNVIQEKVRKNKIDYNWLRVQMKNWKKTEEWWNQKDCLIALTNKWKKFLFKSFTISNAYEIFFTSIDTEFLKSEKNYRLITTRKIRNKSIEINISCVLISKHFTNLLFCFKIFEDSTKNTTVA